MATYSLSIYRITIYKHNKPHEHEYLDCFDDGKSLISIINGMLDRWHDERYLNDYSYDAFDDKRVSRIKRDENGGFMHFHVGPCISGIIESGAYGTEESIIDHKTGDERYRKKKDDAQMIPFYFCFYIPNHSTQGFLVLERIGSNGIFTMLRDAISHEVGKLLMEKHTLKIEPFIVKSVFENNLELISSPSKVFLKGVKSSAFAAGLPVQCMISNNFINAEIVLSIKDHRFNWIEETFNSLINRGNKETLVVDNIECQDVAFQVTIDGRQRKISICDMRNLGTSIDISKEVRFGSDGYPQFDGLEKEAGRLISYIKKDDGKKD